MYIKCWGSRGSVPVSGKEYLKYGGDTTCLEIRTKSNDIIIIDAGTGIRRLGNRLIEENQVKLHFIFTHGHWDHLMGFPFFKPIYDERSQFFMHRCPFPKKYIEKMLSNVMSPPNFPVKYSDLKAEFHFEDTCSFSFQIGSVVVESIPLSHPNTGNGYKFTEDNKSFVFLTDNELNFVHPGGLPYESYLEFCENVDLLIHDAEYTPKEYEQVKEWGHSAYTHALTLALESGVRKLGLFHINQDRTDTQVDRITEICQQRVADKGRNLECFSVASDMVFIL